MAFSGYAVGDLHLCKANLRAMYGESADQMMLSMLERVFRLALRNGVPFVVLLGDVCDTQILDDHVRSALIQVLHRYDTKLDIRIILGNHDVAETAVHSLHTVEALCDLEFFKTVRVYTKHTVEKYRGVYLEFMPWPAEKPEQSHSLCFAHFETKGSTRDNGRRVKDGHDATFESSNQFVQGHLHTPHTNRNHWYVGTMAQQSFGERLPKGYGEFRAALKDGRLSFRHRHIPWQPAYSLHNVVFESRSDVKNYANLLSTLGPNPRIKLFVSEGVRLGDDFLMEHPEIVNRLDYSGDTELQQIQIEEQELETTGAAIDHREVLPAQLESQKATPRQIRRAVQIMANYGK